MTEPRSSPGWRLMLIPPRAGARNMARDVGLMDRARETGEVVFSVYSWERPTLSFGRNQTAVDRYDLDALKELGIDTVRRPTGGRALLHWHEVTYSVTAPADDSLYGWYKRINRILLDALSLLGIQAAESAGEGRAPQPGDLPCFATPSRGELVVNEAKLVGSAQYRENGALLQHGSILLRDDQEMIPSLMRSTAEIRSVKAATVTDALGMEPPIADIASHLFASVRKLEDKGAGYLAEADVAEYTQRHIPEYENELWTWRR